ncbi:hypothetical protein PYCC9005_003266 [Savitreella phatthalungensis]
MFTLFFLVSAALASPCKRSTCSFPVNGTSLDFFDPKFVLGQGLTWSDASRQLSDRMIEIEIDDRSIFSPSPGNVQTGFRRAELLPKMNPVNGTVYMGFEIQRDLSKDLDSQRHEYQLVWLETADYSTNQFVLKVNKGSLELYGNLSKGGPLLKTVDFTAGWHKWAIELDFDLNVLRVSYNDEPRVSYANDLTGGGQYHFGILKKGSEPEHDPHNGTQETGIHEGLVYRDILLSQCLS